MTKFYNTDVEISDLEAAGAQEVFSHPMANQIVNILEGMDVWIWGDWVCQRSKAFVFDDPQESDVESDMRLSMHDRDLGRWEEGMWENIEMQLFDKYEKCFTLRDDEVSPQLSAEEAAPPTHKPHTFRPLMSSDVSRKCRLVSSQLWPVDESVLTFLQILLDNFDAMVYDNRVYLGCLDDEVCLGQDWELMSLREEDLLLASEDKGVAL